MVKAKPVLAESVLKGRVVTIKLFQNCTLIFGKHVDEELWSDDVEGELFRLHEQALSKSFAQ